MPCPLHAVAGGARRRESVSISVRPAPGEGTAGQVPRAGWQLAQSDCHLLTASNPPPPPIPTPLASSPPSLPPPPCQRAAHAVPTPVSLSVCLSVSASADQSVSPPPSYHHRLLCPLSSPLPLISSCLCWSLFLSISSFGYLSVCLPVWLSLFPFCLTSFPVK